MDCDIKVIEDWLPLAEECTLTYGAAGRLCLDNACLESPRERMTAFLFRWWKNHVEELDAQNPQQVAVLKKLSVYLGPQSLAASSLERRTLQPALQDIEICWIYTRNNKIRQRFSYDELDMDKPDVSLRTWTDGVLRVRLDMKRRRLTARFGTQSACSLNLIASLARTLSPESAAVCREAYRERIESCSTADLIVELGSVGNPQLERLVSKRLEQRCKRQSLKHFLRQLGKDGFCLQYLPDQCVRRLGHKMTCPENAGVVETLTARVFGHLLAKKAFGSSDSSAYGKTVLSWFRANEDDFDALQLLDKLDPGLVRAQATHALWTRLPRTLRLQLLKPCREAQLRDLRDEEGDSIWDDMSPRSREEFQEVTLIVGPEKAKVTARLAELRNDAMLARCARRSSSVTDLRQPVAVWQAFLDRKRSGSVGKVKSPRSLAALSQHYKQHRLSAESVDAMQAFQHQVLL